MVSRVYIVDIQVLYSGGGVVFRNIFDSGVDCVPAFYAPKCLSPPFALVGTYLRKVKMVIRWLKLMSFEYLENLDGEFVTIP